MRTFTIFLAALFTLPALADKKKIDLKPKAEKIEDPNSASHLLYQTSPPGQLPGKSPGLKVSATCTDPMGMVHKAGDKGYEACLRSLDKLRPSNPSEKNPNSIGISIGN